MTVIQVRLHSAPADHTAAGYPGAMSRWRLPLAGLVVALMLASKAASVTVRPSDRACLLDWNTPANVNNRQRVVGSGPRSSASLRPGTTFTWKRGSTPMQTTAQACLLALMKSGRLQIVTGTWRDGRVLRWSFGRAIPAVRIPGGSNVKVLPDGRVTKIYLR